MFCFDAKQIYLAGLSLLQGVVTQYGHIVQGSSLRHSLNHILPNVVTHTGDNNTRVRDTAFVTLLALAQHPQVGPREVVSHVTKPMKGNFALFWQSV
jgi:hypothetical protein